MSFLVEFTCSAYRKTAVVEPGCPQQVVGRDPHSTVHLPDPERSISRRHLALDWTDEGVKVTVLSTVNGVSTGDSDIFTGQHIILKIGDSARFGSFTLTIANDTNPCVASRSTSINDTPFDSLDNNNLSAMSVFDDPFFQLKPHNSAYKNISLVETHGDFERKRSEGENASYESKSPQSKGVKIDPYRVTKNNGDLLSDFLQDDRKITSPSISIDSFLSSSASGLDGLGEAGLLKKKNLQFDRKLATDHVHDFNLPFQPSIFQSTTNSVLSPIKDDKATKASAATNISLEKISITSPLVDPWADMQSNWLAAPQCDKPIDYKIVHEENLIGSVAPSFSNAEESPFDDMWSDMPDLQTSIADDIQLNQFKTHREEVHGLSKVENPLQQKLSVNEVGVCLNQISDFPTPLQSLSTVNIPQVALLAFCKGLGVDSPNKLEDVNWEQMGQAVRSIVGGLTGLLNARTEVKRELRVADRTMLASHNNNPLKSEISLDEALQYMLFNPTGIGGYMPANVALDEAIRDLQAHELASVAASRAAVEGTIKEFAPEKIRSVLIKGKLKFPQFLDNARLWDMYTLYYQQKNQHMADWLEQIFNLYFIPTYSRECERFRVNRYVK